MFVLCIIFGLPYSVQRWYFECVNIVWIRMSLQLTIIFTSHQGVKNFPSRAKFCLQHENLVRESSRFVNDENSRRDLWTDVTAGWLWNIHHTSNMNVYRVYHEISFLFTFHMAHGFRCEKRKKFIDFRPNRPANEDVSSTFSFHCFFWSYQNSRLMRWCKVN